MNEKAPALRGATRVNKNVLLGSLILVVVMFLVALAYAVFFSPEDAKPQDLGTSTLSPRAQPSATPTSK